MSVLVMMAWLLSASLLPLIPPVDSSSDESPHVTLFTGALAEHQGVVYPVTDSVIMFLKFDLLKDLKSQIRNVYGAALNLHHHLELLRSKMHVSFNASGTTYDFLAELRSILDPVVPKGLYSPLARDKRALCDGCGSLIGWFTGLVTETELEDYGGRVEAALAGQRQVIRRSLANTKLLEGKVDTVINSVNNITAWVKGELDETRLTFILVLDNIRFTAILRQARDLVGFLEGLAMGLTMAAHGQINPSIVPPSMLGSVLEEALVRNPKLRLLYSNVYMYYPVLRGELSRRGLSIVIPFKPDLQYTAFKIHAFPTLVNNTKLIELAGPLVDKVILKAANSNDFAIMSEEEFNDCVLEQDIFICTDTALVQRPIKLNECIAHLTGFHSDLSVNDCDFAEVDPGWVSHVAVRGHHFLYFAEPKSATVNCDGDSSVVTVKGSYILPYNCSLYVTGQIKVPAVTQFTRNYKFLVPTITPLHEIFSYPNTTVPRKIAHLKGYDDVQMPEMQFMGFKPHHVFLGTVGSVSLSFIAVIIVLIIVVYLLIRRKTGTALAVAPVCYPPKTSRV